MRWWCGTCRPGDMIRVKLGPVWHYGVYASDDEVIAFGLPPWPAPPPPETVRVVATDIDVFACLNACNLIRCEDRVDHVLCFFCCRTLIKNVEHTVSSNCKICTLGNMHIGAVAFYGIRHQFFKSHMDYLRREKVKMTKL